MVEQLPEPGQVLLGGNVADIVVRVGDTVRKPTTIASAGVAEFLEYLTDAGFEGSPRWLGKDESGRQVFEYISGELADTFPPMSVDELAKVGALIRRFHNVAAGFEPSTVHEWEVVIPADRVDLICHHDLAPWNLVRDGDRWVFIDWDGAGPGSRLWDAAYAASTFLPLVAGGDPVSDGVRLSAFVDGYQMSLAEREVFPDMVANHTRGMYDLLVRGDRDGIEPWARLYREGHADHWGQAAHYIETNMDHWRAVILGLILGLLSQCLARKLGCQRRSRER